MDSNLIGTVAAVALAVVAAGGAFLAVRVSIQRRSDNSNKVNIQDVRTSGDVAGRDITKKDK